MKNQLPTELVLMPFETESLAFSEKGRRINPLDRYRRKPHTWNDDHISWEVRRRKKEGSIHTRPTAGQWNQSPISWILGAFDRWSGTAHARAYSDIVEASHGFCSPGKPCAFHEGYRRKTEPGKACLLWTRFDCDLIYIDSMFCVFCLYLTAQRRLV